MQREALALRNYAKMYISLRYFRYIYASIVADLKFYIKDESSKECIVLLDLELLNIMEPILVLVFQK